MITALVQTKLFRPPLRPSLVLRPRIIDKLNAGKDGKLTLVSAPPGFGKTTAVSEWLEQLPAGSRVAWLSLEDGDNDPARFFAYLIGALQTVDPTIGRELTPESQLPPPEAVTVALINDIAAAPQSLILVLDDYHAITVPAIHEAIVYLVDQMPPQMHLVILGRADPPFSLSRLRVRRELTEIRARDLRFTTAEASDFLGQSMGLELSSDDVALLERRTEGWIAGLQLAAHSLQLEDDKSAFLAAFAGDDRFIADYLIEEVLARQTESIQVFLLQSSILNKLCGPLCDFVLEREDSQSNLEFLEGSNLFVVPLDNRRQWYRYHHLFGDLLRERLEASHGELSQLHLRASEWYVENGFAPEAVEHALSAAKYDRAVTLILGCADEMFMTSRLSTVLRWWQQIPYEVSGQNPWLSMLAAWAWLATGNAQESERCLQAVEGALGLPTSVLLGDIDALESGIRIGLIEVATARLSIQSGVEADATETLAFCQRVLPYLVEGEQPFLINRPIDLRPVVLFNIGLAYQALGRLEDAVKAYEEAVALGRSLGNVHIVAVSLGHKAEIEIVQGRLRQAAETCRRGTELVAALAGRISPLCGLLHVLLGKLHYEWNELVTAEQHVQEGIKVARPWRNMEALLPGYLALARIYRVMGRDQQTLEAQEAFNALVASEVNAAEPLAGAAHARLLAEGGEFEAAWRWADQFSLRYDGESNLEAEAIGAVRIRLLQGEFGEADALLGGLLEPAESGGRWGHVVEMLVLRATIHEARGEREAALESLGRALKLAEPEGSVRTFVDGGDRVARLLPAAAAAGDIAPSYSKKVLNAFPTGEEAPEITKSAAPPNVVELPEALSERELEVLQLIAEGWTNKEIAARLHLAPGTVKVHAHNIYGKLGVGGRTQAVAEARRLNILD